MAVLNISDEASKILSEFKKKGTSKKWLASTCIINHAKDYVKKDEVGVTTNGEQN